MNKRVREMGTNIHLTYNINPTPFKKAGKVDHFRKSKKKLLVTHGSQYPLGHVERLHCRLRVPLLQSATLPHHASINEQRAHTSHGDTVSSSGM